MIANDFPTILGAALAGVGLAQVPEPIALEHLASGALEEVLAAHAPKIPGVFLYLLRTPPSAAETARLHRAREGEPRAAGGSSPVMCNAPTLSNRHRRPMPDRLTLALIPGAHAQPAERRAAAPE